VITVTAAATTGDSSSEAHLGHPVSIFRDIQAESQISESVYSDL
jgi:hypothetical protein